MKSIEQLADTTSTSVASVIPEIWSAAVEEAAREVRRGREYIRKNTDLLNKGGDIVYLPKRGTLIASALAGEGTITPSELTYDSLKLEPAEVGAAVQVTKDAIEESKVDLLRDCTTELGEALAQKEDVDILAALSSATTNTVYGGDATSTADIASGDTLTPQLVIKAISYVRDDNFNPDVLFIAPEQQYTLGTHSQFEANKFGSTEVINRGIIGSYFGVTVVTSTNVPSGTGGTATDVAYHDCILMDSKRAGAIAIKRNPTVETDYNPLSRRHQIAATMKYAVGLLNDAAVCKIVVSDA